MHPFEVTFPVYRSVIGWFYRGALEKTDVTHIPFSIKEQRSLMTITVRRYRFRIEVTFESYDPVAIRQLATSYGLYP